MGVGKLVGWEETVFAGADERRSQPATLVRLQLAPCVWGRKVDVFIPSGSVRARLRLCTRGLGARVRKKADRGNV